MIEVIDYRHKGLILADVVLAVAIASAGLFLLTRLHLSDLRLIQQVEWLSGAISVASSKMAQIQTTGVIDQKTGQAQEGGLSYNWQVLTEQAKIDGFDRACQMRVVSINVTPDGMSMPVYSLKGLLISR